MISWSETDAGLRAFDRERTTLLVRAPDWEGASEHTDGGVDGGGAGDDGALATGTVSELRFPAASGSLLTESGEDVPILPDRDRRVGPGDHRLALETGIAATLWFPGPARLLGHGDEVLVRFPERRRVTLGLRSREAIPDGSIAVPPTPSGLAAALTRAAATPRSTGPDRSAPERRPHPPTFEFDPNVDVPRPEPAGTGIELRLPDSFESLILAAPLAYYLGARVTVDEREVAPLLSGPDGLLDRPLSPLAETAPALLRRTFWLDCLIRDRPGPRLAETGLRSRLALDSDALREAPMAVRLRRYLDAPFERVAADLPEWPLAMYVEPTVENAAALPYLLARLAAIYRPETTALAGQELMERSLDDFYRAGARDVPTIEVDNPQLRRGDIHGWLATGTPIDVFKSVPEAYEHRHEYLSGPDRGSLRVAVVLNDPTMIEEGTGVAAVYRERTADLPIDVRIHRDLSTSALADVFAERHDLVHYVGHCETDGLLCSDGNLAVAELSTVNAETFFLNACASFHEGVDLVRRGSVGGAVTYREVLDEQAATVGTTFARLLGHGFGLERAIGLARRRIMMGKDYAVVGDGTHALARSRTGPPMVVHVDPLDDGRFRVVCEAAAEDAVGSAFHAPIPGNAATHLRGGEAQFRLDAADLATFLTRVDAPVVYDGQFHWPGEVPVEP